MTATIIATVLTTVLAVASIRFRRTGRRVAGVLLGLVAVLPGLVAARDLPGPLIDTLLIAALFVIAGITAWPLLRRRPADRVGRGGGES